MKKIIKILSIFFVLCLSCTLHAYEWYEILGVEQNSKPYEILKLWENSSNEDIEDAFERKILSFYPKLWKEKNQQGPNNKNISKDECKKVLKACCFAYEALKNGNKDTCFNDSSNVSVQQVLNQFFEQRGIGELKSLTKEEEELFESLFDENTNNLKELLQTDVNVNAINCRDFVGCTPLHVASNHCKIEKMKLLLCHGANPNAKSHEGTPLHLVLKNRDSDEKSKLATVKVLVEHEAEVNAKENKIEYKSQTTPLIKAILSRLPDVANYFIEQGAEVNICDNWGRTPLYAALITGQDEFALSLIKDHGADVNFINPVDLWFNGGQSALHMICERAYSEGSQNELVRILLENKATVDIRNSEGETPLHIAAGEGDYETVELLLGYGDGAQADAKSNEDKTPLDYAKESRSEGGAGDYDTVELLLSGVTSVGAKSEGYQDVEEPIIPQEQDKNEEEDNIGDQVPPRVELEESKQYSENPGQDTQLHKKMTRFQTIKNFFSRHKIPLTMVCAGAVTASMVLLKLLKKS